MLHSGTRIRGSPCDFGRLTAPVCTPSRVVLLWCVLTCDCRVKLGRGLQIIRNVTMKVTIFSPESFKIHKYTLSHVFLIIFSPPYLTKSNCTPPTFINKSYTYLNFQMLYKLINFKVLFELCTKLIMHNDFTIGSWKKNRITYKT